MKNKILTILLTFILLSFLSLTTYAYPTMSITNRVVNKQGTLENNVTYESFSSILIKDGVSTNQNISYVKKANEATNIRPIVWSKTSSGSSNATLENIAIDFEKQNPNTSVIAGINADYFYGNNSINAQMSNGELIQSTNHNKYSSISISEDGSSLYQSQTLTLEKNYSLTLYDELTNQVIKEVIVLYNNLPNDVYLTSVYYGKTTGYSFNGGKIFDTRLDNHISRALSTQVFKGKVLSVVDTTPTIENNLRICTSDKELIKILENNPTYKISKYFSQGNNQEINVVGVGSKPLSDGKILEYEEIKDQSLDFCKARHPRSSVGVTSNGDLIICAIDGRQTNMKGVDLCEEAFIMKELGCVSCYNFDGGGSTQLLIKENNKFTYLNSPSETRNVTNALLFVSYDVGTKYSIEHTSDNITFSSQIDTEEFVKAEYYINDKKVYESTNKEETNITLNETIDERFINYFSIVVTYIKDKVTLRKAFVNKRIVASDFTGTCVKIEKENYEIHFELNGGTLLNFPLEDGVYHFKKDAVVTLEEPIKEGYRFIGYYDNGNLITTIVNRDYYLSAKWEKINYYDVTFNLDGGTCSNLPEKVSDEEILLPIPEKDGYIFLGWYSYGNKITSVGGKGEEVVAKWEKIKTTYYISYDLDDGTCDNLITSFIDDEEITLPVPTKEGFTFLGWFENGEKVTKLNNKNYTLRAMWEDNNPPQKGCNNLVVSINSIISIIGLLYIFKKH